MKKIFLILLLLLSFNSFSQQIEVKNYVLADDKTSTFKYDMGYNTKYKNHNYGAYFGIANYSDSNQVILYNFNLSSKFNFKKSELNINLSDNFNENNNFFLYDVLLKIKPNKYLYTEILLSKDLIGTTYTIDNKYVIYSNGIVSDVYILDGIITFTGGYIYQYYTDVNHRNIEIAKIYVKLIGDLYFFTSAKFIQFDETRSYYFSPNKFNTYTIGTFYTFKFNKDNFILKPTVYGGQQKIDNESKNVYAVEVKFKGWVKEKYGINLNIGYTNAANGYGYYDYFIFNLGLIYRLK